MKKNGATKEIIKSTSDRAEYNVIIYSVKGDDVWRMKKRSAACMDVVVVYL